MFWSAIFTPGHDGLLDGGEVAALHLGLAARPAEEVLDQGEHRRESTTKSALPRSGSILKMLMEVGTGRTA
jgi:hypothetical protein